MCRYTVWFVAGCIAVGGGRLPGVFAQESASPGKPVVYTYREVDAQAVNAEGSYRSGRPDALVLWSPAPDVSADGYFRRLLRGRATVEAYSPVEHVRPRMPSVHIVHGERDTLTPLSGARRFCERVRAGGGHCELVVDPGVGHMLTRNLADQESDFDPDPVARDDGNGKQLEFLKSLWIR